MYICLFLCIFCVFVFICLCLRLFVSGAGGFCLFVSGACGVEGTVVSLSVCVSLFECVR